MSSQNEEDESLAGEYVLGTLSSAERLHFEARMAREARLRRSAERWSNLFDRLADLVPPVRPRPQVWTQIEAGIRGRAAMLSDAVDGLRRQLAIWRGFALASSFAAVAALAYLGSIAAMPQHGSMYVAMLTDDAAKPAWLITVDARSHELTAKPLAVAAQQDHAYELWVIPSGGRGPVSLGLLNASAPLRMRMPEAEAGMVPQAGALAVSLEPPGGSPSKAPTGPVMHKGVIVSQEF